jgi:hypothetical protein
MQMKLHALLNWTLYRGELLALICNPFTPEKSLKIGIPIYNTVVLNWVYINIFYKLSTIRQNGLKKYPDAIFSEESKLCLL